MGGVVLALLAPSPLPRLHKLAGILVALAKLQTSGQPEYQHLIVAIGEALRHAMARLPAGDPCAVVANCPELDHPAAKLAAQAVGILAVVLVVMPTEPFMHVYWVSKIPACTAGLGAVCIGHCSRLHLQRGLVIPP